MTLGIEAFQEAAATLDLRLEAPDLPWWKNVDLAMLEGAVDGVRVLVQQGYADRYPRVYFHAAVEPQLDLGLSLSLKAPWFWVGDPLSMADAPGSPRFDAAFTLRAAEPARALTLFTPELHAAVVGWHNARRREYESKNTLEFWLSDDSVILRVGAGYFKWGMDYREITAEELVSDVRGAAGLARAVAVAARHVPPSRLFEPHFAAWEAFARARGLVFSASPLRVAGSYGGVDFQARAASFADNAYGVEIAARLARPLPFYLRLGPSAGWLDFSKRWAAYPDAWAEWVRGQKTGDATFDDKIRVVAVDGEGERRLLDADVRRAILELLAQHGHVSLTSEWISIRSTGMISPDTFDGIVAPLTALEKLIDRAMGR